ncbi:MAG: hypothetical protein NDJ89_03805 [Oligoflexia bacterium]|nr:hypothetical protein [Oligoflexia bacterium]
MSSKPLLVTIFGVSILALSTASCTRLQDSNTGSQRDASREASAIYPHSETFKSTAEHGGQYLKDAQTCASCHGDPLSGARSAVARQSRACNACHEAYPHPERFKLTRDHGTSYRNSPESCTSCHGKELDGGPSKLPSCTQCHASYPHTAEFKKSAEHGGAFLQDRKGCASCHTLSTLAPEQEDREKRSCQSCHAYPHEPAWGLAANHGTAFVAIQKQPDQCLSCHGETSGFRERHGSKFVSCASCHIQLPHTKNFKRGRDTHVSDAQSYAGNCTACHTNYTRLLPNTNENGCFNCHDEEMVVKARWVDPNAPEKE